MLMTMLNKCGMVFLFGFHLLDFASEFFVTGQQLAEFNKRLH
jgi:hypothetical protein